MVLTYGAHCDLFQRFHRIWIQTNFLSPIIAISLTTSSAPYCLRSSKKSLHLRGRPRPSMVKTFSKSLTRGETLVWVCCGWLIKSGGGRGSWTCSGFTRPSAFQAEPLPFWQPSNVTRFECWSHVQLIPLFRPGITYHGLRVNLTPYLLPMFLALVSNTAPHE